MYSEIHLIFSNAYSFRLAGDKNGRESTETTFSSTETTLEDETAAEV